MTVYVLGSAAHPACLTETRFRLEEMVYRVSRAALDNAGVSRGQLDHVTLAGSDELDGRPISSMLLAMPAGAYLTDEIKVTDSGLAGLCLAYARILSGEFDLGLAASWCKSSKTELGAVARMREEPFYTRPLGLDDSAFDALFAQAVGAELGITQAQIAELVENGHARAQANPRGLRADIPAAADIAQSPYVATPVREGHIAQPSDGAASIVLASQRFLDANPDCRPICKISAAGWITDSYALGTERLTTMNSFRSAWAMMAKHANLTEEEKVDIIELEAPTAWHEAAYRKILEGRTRNFSPSGGAYAQNPVFCAGMINAHEVILQLAGEAGPVQCDKVSRAVAHGCHGFAQQSNAFILFEGMGGDK